MNLRVDILAREIFGRAAIAAGMGDKDAALAVCRDLVDVEGAYRLTLRVGEQHARTTGSAFVGKPMRARFASRCAVCSMGISEGAEIIYASEIKKAAHAGCAEVAP